jgi:hypothetical protein
LSIYDLIQRGGKAIEQYPSREVSYDQFQQGGRAIQQPQEAPKQADERPVVGNRAQGILSAIGGGLKGAGGTIGRLAGSLASNTSGFLRDNPDFLDTATIAVEGMSLRPNQPLIQMAQNRMIQREEQAGINKTADYLRSQGRSDLADAVLANPELSLDALKQASGIGALDRQFAISSSTPRTDPETGQLYVVQVDPSTGETIRVNVGGAFDETQEQSFARLTQEKGQEQAWELARELGKEIQGMGRTNLLYDQLIDLIENQGAESGYLDTYIGGMFNAQTAMLSNIANRLGLQIISGVTFGALSEKEMTLAMQTALPTGLTDKDDLRDWVIAKKAADRKLAQELSNRIQILHGEGMTLNKFYQQQAESFAQKGFSIDQNMTEEALDALNLVSDANVISGI